jgi:iron complex transport system permease protein
VKSMQHPWITVRFRRLPISFHVDRRVPLVLTLVILATLAAMVVNIGVGEYLITPLDVIRTALRLPVDNPDYDFIVNTLRLPRMLVAALVGMALGTSGAIMQGLTRNPLADPGIMGISGGAGLVAVLLIVVIKDVPAGVIPIAAFGGALVMAGLIYVLAWRGGDSPIRMILIGIGLGAITGAATSLMITFGDVFDVQRALIWLSGSVYGRSWDEFWPLLPWVAMGMPVAMLFARHLNALNLGEEVVRGLGSSVAIHRGLLLVTAVGLAASTVAAAGAIGFVGLMAPHIARRLVGPDHAGLLPTAGIFGSFIVVAADLIGRTVVAPVEIPVGLVTAVVGAPFFLYLLWTQRGR